MSDVIPLSRFMYDLRNLCSEGEFIELNYHSPEFVETKVDEIKIRVRNLVGLCETVIRYDALTDDEIRRLEPSTIVAKTELVLRQILADDKSPLETLLDNLPHLRKYLGQLPPLDEPKRFAVKDVDDTPAEEPATKKEHSPWIDAPKMIELMRANAIRGKSDSTITRRKTEWEAEFQQGSNCQLFRFKLARLQEIGITFPPEWNK